MANTTINSTTQIFLDIHDITNDMIIMKDGTTSLILTVDAMNFGLLAEEEQDAIMYSYAGLLNSLNYSIQILINSTTKDVTSYLKLLEEQEQTALSETMKRRIRQYREFVGNLIHERNVLDKKFYVIIPATALEMGFVSAQSVVPGVKQSGIEHVEKSIIIEKASTLLEPKRDHLLTQFARIGLFSRQLTTQEIIQLFYIKYNPEAAEGQKIDDSSSYVTPMVKADIQQSLPEDIHQYAPDPELPEPANLQLGQTEMPQQEVLQQEQETSVLPEQPVAAAAPPPPTTQAPATQPVQPIQPVQPVQPAQPTEVFSGQQPPQPPPITQQPQQSQPQQPNPPVPPAPTIQPVESKPLPPVAEIK